jgi:hypothetical protein
LGSIHSKETDYNFRKAEWLLKHAQTGDVLNTADSFVFTFYLNYWSGEKVEVRNLNTQSWKKGKTTYVLGDLFAPSLPITVRYPEYINRIQQTRSILKPLSRKVHDDAFGGVWIVEPASSR